jgi:hypothetical protein
MAALGLGQVFGTVYSPALARAGMAAVTHS